MSNLAKASFFRRDRILRIVAIGVATAGFFTTSPGTSIRSQPASASQFWGALQAGPFAVGFRTIYRFDPTRTWRITRPYKRPFAPDLNGRPIRVSVWYPAKLNRSNRQMHYEDYIRTETEGEFADLAKVLERRDRLIAGLSVPPNRVADLMAASVNAFKNAPVAAGRYPLVLHFAGLNDASTINSFVLAEFLASHGYVVATVALLGETIEQTGQSRTPADIERTIKDMEFAWSLLRKETNVDESRVAVTGHSLGGIEALLFSMRNANVSAVVGLDGTYGFAGDSVKVLTDFYGYQPQNMRAAFLDLRKAEGEQETVLDLSAVRAFRYSDRTLVTVRKMHHSDFSSFAMVAQEFHLGNSPGYVDKSGWTRETGYRGYQVICAIVRDFLDEKLKEDRQAADRLVADVARADGGQLRRESELPAPPSPKEFVTLIAQKGVDAAIAVVESYRGQMELDRIVNERGFNSLGYDLLAEKRFSEAIGLFKLVTFVYPGSANSADSLGDAYVAANQKADARAAYQRALELVATDPRFDAPSKTAFAKDEELKIERLKP